MVRWFVRLGDAARAGEELVGVAQPRRPGLRRPQRLHRQLAEARRPRAVPPWRGVGRAERRGVAGRHQRSGGTGSLLPVEDAYRDRAAADRIREAPRAQGAVDRPGGGEPRQSQLLLLHRAVTSAETAAAVGAAVSDRVRWLCGDRSAKAFALRKRRGRDRSTESLALRQ